MEDLATIEPPIMARNIDGLIAHSGTSCLDGIPSFARRVGASIWVEPVAFRRRAFVCTA